MNNELIKEIRDNKNKLRSWADKLSEVCDEDFSQDTYTRMSFYVGKINHCLRQLNEDGRQWHNEKYKYNVGVMTNL